MGLKTAHYIICDKCGIKNINIKGYICYSNTVKDAYNSSVVKGWVKKGAGKIECPECARETK